jgi:hypothetical protein
MNMRKGEWYAQHFHRQDEIKPLLERHGLIVIKLDAEAAVWRAVCKKGKINTESCLKSIEREFNMKYNKNQSYEKGQIVREALSCVYC